MSEPRDIDTLRLHPDAERVPAPAEADRRALRDSLQENGQEDPIDVTEDGVILDGRTRWTVLRELGFATVQVRTVHIPPERQTAYIIDRALSRRHLNAEQKRALNVLLREQVVEVAVHPKTQEPVRIGRTVQQRADALGVDKETVKRWDADSAFALAASAPTHIRLSDGRINPVRHPDRKPPAPKVSRTARPEPLRKSRPIPYWSRHFAAWIRRAQPEDRDFLARMDRDLHDALKRTGVRCEKEETA